MPRVLIHKNGESFSGEVKENSNLVVRAGIRQFPWPHLQYGCGMGRCGSCASRVISGADQLPAPNWKEEKALGARLAEGYRLMCQFWITADIEIAQERSAQGPRRVATPAVPPAQHPPKD
jgi:ferredoxin